MGGAFSTIVVSPAGLHAVHSKFTVFSKHTALCTTIFIQRASSLTLDKQIDIETLKC